MWKTVTNKIVDIWQNEEHEVSEVICVKCCKRWIAVRPSGVLLKQIECPNCGSGFAINTGQVLDNE